MDDQIKLFPPQSLAVYRLLAHRVPMTAKDIGEKLGIFPNAVYRSLRPLIESGFVREVEVYPARFEANSYTDAIDFYSSKIRDSFLSGFSQMTPGDEKIGISFIKTRTELLDATNSDIEDARDSANFIVSGLEVPAETILAYKKSVERGVLVRTLVQNLDDTNGEMLSNWQRIGIKVRYYPNMEARIFVVDRKIVYFTSYDPKNKEEATGVRFAYSPFAKIMGEVFENRWKVAKPIK